MQAAVKIVDWTPGTPRQARPVLRLVSETLTAGELIVERITAECGAINKAEELTATEREARIATWLVVPGTVERTLNGAPRTFGPGTVPRKTVDPDEYIAIARKAFESGQFVMLFDGRQIEAWDERITIQGDSLATFIKLTPLRGG